MRPAVFVAGMLLLCSSGIAVADDYIQGYRRKDGTYVQPHYRSERDGNPYNNYSYPGNTNPYTGEQATGTQIRIYSASNSNNMTRA